MPVIVTKEIKKRRILIAFLVVLIGAIFSILYFGGIIGGGSRMDSTETVQPSAQSGVSSGGAENNQGIQSPISDDKLRMLEDERFKSLQSPPGVPVKTDTTGKSNPFSD